ncbi:MULTISPECIES: NAD-dependent epimerase/dehydratase family protein [unclassified Bosea (in: a-proteobacteria)]|uniref:NAD-dependent epimerase/dehydratase family protein n=1 Tax=unclassified Bosea (in: a-proteobacteria) TaxID=2653178 RepID=UPI000954F744|nr:MULTISPECIES: NAD-dependent epimerase/dehydratase family protein [unclassified Bosea (in: a-proteobacteria)]TAJ31230.1 MAG: NAD-dependent epimerase/dehydratase family protein [Bosea sp. (in: a-proteobacteria)]SIQ96044.1 UDP-glucose 4-epimerase [Bosea sp. TND4EK4]
MAEPRILVTGATGFVGPHVVTALTQSGYRLRLALRRPGPARADVETVVVGDMAGPIDWAPALLDVDHVVHMAGLAHAGPGLDEALYRRINTDATRELARAAQEAGIRRFVYLSSVKALTGAFDGPPLAEDAVPAPDDAYGRSKLAAEQGLAALDLDWVALRPVLIYGPGVKANMAALLRLARLPLPLPFGGLQAPRSLLAVENLASAILFALGEDCPPRRCCLVADPEPISVAGMIAALRAGLGRGPGLMPVPAHWLRGLARRAGREETFVKLAGSLVARPQRLLSAGWRPPVETEAALARLAASARAG